MTTNTTLIMYPGGFEQILNFRDVGKTVNDQLGKKLVDLPFKATIATDTLPGPEEP